MIRQPYLIDGSPALTARGTVVITLEDGREVTVDVHDLDLDVRKPSNRGEVTVGVNYLECSVEPLGHAMKMIDRGPAYLMLEMQLRAVDDEAFTIKIPNAEEAP